MKFVGIDLGGHTITAGEVDFGGSLPAVKSPVTIQTPKERELSKVLRAIEELVLLYAAPGEKIFVGIGIPGFVDGERRRVARLTNFERCDGAAVADMLNSLLKGHGIDAEVRIENDANCVAIGEKIAGAARGMNDFVVLTLGSGIGTGIFANGRLLSGAHGMAGECGHMALISSDSECGCGGVGHLERYFSGDVIEKLAKEAGLPNDFRELWARRGEKEAAALIEPAIETFARGISSIAVTLDPEVIILSGGISRAEGLETSVRERIEKYLPIPFRRFFEIKISQLGGAAALIGAASLGQEMDSE